MKLSSLYEGHWQTVSGPNSLQKGNDWSHLLKGKKDRKRWVKKTKSGGSYPDDKDSEQKPVR